MIVPCNKSSFSQQPEPTDRGMFVTRHNLLDEFAESSQDGQEFQLFSKFELFGLATATHPFRISKICFVKSRIERFSSRFMAFCVVFQLCFPFYPQTTFLFV